MSSLSGKTAIVTGAARGIGAATARKLASLSARVAVVDLDLDVAESTAAQIRAEGGQAQALRCDVAKPAECEDLVADVGRLLGPVDILINNAAICPRIPLDEMTEAWFDQLFNVNVKSVFFLSRAAAEAMKPRIWGRIVNLSSTGGRIGGITNATVYGGTKAAILAITKSMARHYAPWNILVNAVAPGAVETRMITMLPAASVESVKESGPLKRLARPEEIANVIAFLASEEASWITGSTVDVNGGTLML